MRWKKNKERQVSKIRKTIHKQNKNLTNNQNCKKRTKGKSKEYNEWNIKVNRGHWHQKQPSRRKNLLIRRQDLWNFPLRGEQRKNDWIRIRKVYMIYKVLLTGAISNLLVSKKTRGRREQKTYLNNGGKLPKSKEKFRYPSSGGSIGNWTNSTERDLLQDTL